MPEREHETTICPECGGAISTHDREETGQSEYCAACYRATLDELLGQYHSAKESGGDFIGLGPDGDFTGLGPERKRLVLQRIKGLARRRPPAAELDAGQSAIPPDEVAKVVATLVRAGEAEEEPPRERTRQWYLRRRPVRVVDTEDLLAAEELAQARLAARSDWREETRRRWSFMYEPRRTAETALASTRIRAGLFAAAIILAASLLWSLPNAFLFPGDAEYAIHGIGIGIGIGLLLWWKAGRAHSTRLALQAGGLTLAALFCGEMLHWTFVIASNSFFRTVFNVISTRFFFTNLPDVMGKLLPELFPFNFVVILVLPSLLAFAIGFGAPPIPELFIEGARSLRPRSGKANGSTDTDAG